MDSASLHPRSRSTALFAAISIVLPAVAYMILGDAPLILLLTLPAVIPAVLIKKSVPISTRSLVYTITIAATVGVLLNQVYKVDGDRFFMPLPTEIIFPICIGLAVGLNYLEQRPRILAGIIMVMFLGLCMQSTVLNDLNQNVRLELPEGPLRDRYWIFGTFAILYGLVIMPLIIRANPVSRRERRAQTAEKPQKHGYRRRWLAVSIVGLVVCTVSVGFALPLAFKQADGVITPFFWKYMRTPRSPAIFGEQVNLRQTFDLKQNRNANKIALKIRSSQAPGYLRGRVYDEYRDGQWKAKLSELVYATEEVDKDLAVKRFRMQKANNPDASSLENWPFERMDVFIMPTIRTDVLYMPGHAVGSEMIAARLMHDRNGTSRPYEWDSQGGYTVFSDRSDQTATWPEPTPVGGLENAYLEVPTNIRPLLRAILAEVKNSDMLAGKDRPSDREMIRATAFFLQNYAEYELGTEMHPDKDPVEWFLTETRRGHCELFASAAAMLLREAGIPTRYVSGFVSFEPHPVGNAYVARLRDAHAWIEAYDRQQGQWVLAEATPASGVPSAEDRSSIWEAAVEMLKLRWQSLYSLIKRGYFADAILAFLGGIWALLKVVFWSPWALLSWPMLIICVIFCHRRLRGRAVSSGFSTSDSREDLCAILPLIEEKLRHARIVRRPTMTIQDIIADLRPHSEPAACHAVELLQTYQMLRYCPNPPEKESVISLKQKVLVWRRQSFGGRQ